MNCGGIVFELDCRLQISFGFGKAFESRISVAAIVECFGVIGLQLYRRRIIVNRLGELSRLVANGAAIVVSLGQLRVKLNCLVVSGKSLRHVSVCREFVAFGQFVNGGKLFHVESNFAFDFGFACFVGIVVIGFKLSHQLIDRVVLVLQFTILARHFVESLTVLHHGL